MKTLSIFLIIFFLFTNSNTQARDSARFSVGVGVFNYMEDGSPPHNDQSGMINLEVHSGRKMFNLIKPFAGFLYTMKMLIMLTVVLELTDTMEKRKILFGHQV